MKRALLAIVLALACGVAGWYARQFALPPGGSGAGGSGVESGSQAASSASAPGGQETVVGMGRIEPAGGVIDVGAMMGDRLGRLLVEEGTNVEKGAPLAELESRSLRKLELEAATSQLQNAEGRLEVETQLADVKIEAAKLNVKRAEAAGLTMAAHQRKIEFLKVGFALAQTDQKRLAGLSKDLASQQDRERQALLVQQAESELESAKAMVSQLDRTNELGLKAAKLELVGAEDAKKQLPFAIPVESLRINRKLAETQYERTQITAPCNGTILRTYVRPGETISNKPILQIADLRQMVVVAEVYENEIKHIRLGQQALVTSRAFQPPYDQKGLHGKVIRVGRMISSPVLKSIDPFAPADRHVVEVRVELDKDGSRQSAALSNLQVDVRFPNREYSSSKFGQLTDRST